MLLYNYATLALLFFLVCWHQEAPRWARPAMGLLIWGFVTCFSGEGPMRTFLIWGNQNNVPEKILVVLALAELFRQALRASARRPGRSGSGSGAAARTPASAARPRAS